MAAACMMFLLFCAGVLFAWFVASPFAVNFFAGFADPRLLPLLHRRRLRRFCLPAFSWALAWSFSCPSSFGSWAPWGWFRPGFCAPAGSYALILILIVAAVVTPLDVVSQVLMAIPMLALYELGIILVATTERARRRRMQEDGKAAP